MGTLGGKGLSNWLLSSSILVFAEGYWDDFYLYFTFFLNLQNFFKDSVRLLRYVNYSLEISQYKLRAVTADLQMSCPIQFYCYLCLNLKGKEYRNIAEYDGTN